MYAVIDFETRSRADLKNQGVSVYARHPSTEVMCLAYNIGGGHPTKLWHPGADDKILWPLLALIEKGFPVYAHNAGFERNIWYHICHKRMGWPDVPATQWRCSLACCSRLTLPRGLEKAAEAAGLPIKKDLEGHRIMMQLCKPKKDDTFDTTPAKLERLYSYCIQDVDSEAALIEEIDHLTPSELKVWQLDQQINMRGLKIDRQAVEEALATVNEVYEDACVRLNKATGGRINTPKQVAAIQAFLQNLGVTLPNLAAETVSEALGGDLPPLCREVLSIRQLASKASTAKLKAMLARADEDDRVRGNVIYHGASTGRWAGVGLQIQNFPRGVLNFSDVNLARELFPLCDPKAIDLMLGPPIDIISSCLRSMIVAEDNHRLMVCDFASIEARVLAWIAGQANLLQTFRDGGDVYKDMASKIYGVPVEDVSKEQRFVGKTAILGLGYGMGHRAFKLACKTMAGVEIEMKMAKHVVKRYRESNDRIRAFWGELNSAATRCVETGKTHRVGRLELRCDKYLYIRLPSGRNLHYYDPKIEMVVAPWTVGHTGSIFWTADQHTEIKDLVEELDITLGQWVMLKEGWVDCDFPKGAAAEFDKVGLKITVQKKEPKKIPQVTYMSVGSRTRRWEKTRSYGGKFTENVVQGIARDYLAEAMLRVEQKGYPIVGTVHDEIIVEVHNDHGSMDEYERIMSQVPEWGKGCPIGVEGFETQRYRK